MSEVFKTKVRKIGNALGVIIPKKVLKKVHATEGEEIEMIIPASDPQRQIALKNVAGLYKGAKPFVREFEDRY
jgi:antitoxin component of MazEF toxin-antitoxin module